MPGGGDFRERFRSLCERLWHGPPSLVEVRSSAKAGLSKGLQNQLQRAAEWHANESGLILLGYFPQAATNGAISANPSLTVGIGKEHVYEHISWRLRTSQRTKTTWSSPEIVSLNRRGLHWIPLAPEFEHLVRIVFRSDGDTENETFRLQLDDGEKKLVLLHGGDNATRAFFELRDI